MNKTTLIRQLTVVVFLLLLGLPLYAQEQTDSVFTFRFFPGKNQFYVPFGNNGKELTKLLDCVEQCKGMIKNHEMYVYVNGYCNTKGGRARDLAIAKIRSNRVKSELIVRRGITEDCFITRNHSGVGDFVEVSIAVPKDSISKLSLQPVQKTAEKEEVVKNDTVVEIKEPVVTSDSIAPVEKPVLEEDSLHEVVDEPRSATPVRLTEEKFALKTNLLGYAVLMPNIEVEWMFADRWSAALEAQSAWYSKSSPHKVYRLATVTPEVRYWTINRSRWHGMYVGAFGGVGLYDLSDGKKGHEGEGFMAGFSVGYMWPISKHLSLDAGLGVGYLRARDKVYVPEDGHYLYQYTKNIDYVGPLRLKLSLVWRIQSEKRNRKK